MVGCEYANVNLAFGTYEYNVPDVAGKSFVDQQPIKGWDIDAARVLATLSKISYEASPQNLGPTIIALTPRRMLPTLPRAMCCCACKKPDPHYHFPHALAHAPSLPRAMYCCVCKNLQGSISGLERLAWRRRPFPRDSRAVVLRARFYARQKVARQR